MLMIPKTKDVTKPFQKSLGFTNPVLRNSAFAPENYNIKCEKKVGQAAR